MSRPSWDIQFFIHQRREQMRELVGGDSGVLSIGTRLDAESLLQKAEDLEARARQLQVGGRTWTQPPLPFLHPTPPPLAAAPPSPSRR
jgi:hypothetical protein